MTESIHNLAAILVGGGERAARVAIREPLRSWTYGELAANVARAGCALEGLGVRRGDRVAVLMPDCLEAAAAILGAMWMGAVAVPVSELMRASDIRGILCDAGALVAIVDEALAPVFDSIG